MILNEPADRSIFIFWYEQFTITLTLMNILEVQHISKQYANHKALSDVSFSIPKGSIFGLLGPNGAGKTSLIRIITQITQPDSGTILFNGQPLQPNHIQQIGYLPEERGLYKKMEVGEQLLYFAQLKGMSRAEALEKLKVWVDKFEIRGWWKKKVEELSKGMQQKIQFIATVIHQPSLIILDEPFSGFDPINANLITEEILALKAKGSSIIFSTHRMESVEQLCDRIALINLSKKVLEGSVNEVRDRYRSHTYLIEYTEQSSISLSPHFDIKEQTVLPNGNQLMSVQLINGSTANQLLHELLPQLSIIRFEEKLPGMQEIFISAVSENKTM
jgi:ABC-2 type transport system ATP-binding protein